MRLSRAHVAAPLLLLSLPALSCGGDDSKRSGSASSYSALVVFGDSLSDSGTYNPTTADLDPSNDSPVGLPFTTHPGSVWVDYIAEALGISLTPNLRADFGAVGVTGRLQTLGGTNYAEGGARIATGGEDDGLTTLEIPDVGTMQLQQASQHSIKNQIDRWSAAHPEGFAPGQLVIIQGGANDLFGLINDTPAVELEARAGTLIEEKASAMAAQVGRLVDAGASTIIYANVPDLGRTPLYTNLIPSLSATATELSAAYNTAVASKLANLPVTLFDTWGMFHQVLENPATFQLTNVSAPACNSFTVPGSASSLTALLCTSSTLVEPGADQRYLFADWVHPTSKGHKLWAAAVASALLQE